MGKVLITATHPRGDEFTAHLLKNNISAISLPVLEVQYSTSEKSEGYYKYLLITSVHALNADLPNLPVIAVGDETASQARKKGYEVIEIGQGGVRDIDLSNYDNILYPCAHEPTYIPDLCHPWPVYQTIANSRFQIDNDVDIICVFSVRAAKEIRKHDLKDKKILCLSNAIREAFYGTDYADIASCMYPRYDAMENLINQYL